MPTEDFGRLCFVLPEQPDTKETSGLFPARLDQIIDMRHELRPRSAT